MMIWSDKPVYICCEKTDMRKSINGLMILVKESFLLDPFSDGLFVFCNKRRNRLKILEWDNDGFWVYFKRLERGHFRWPSQEDSSVMVLKTQELSYLIEGAKLEKKLKREEVFVREIS